MDFTHYSDQCMQSAADLVNTRGHPSGNEYMGTPELAKEFLLAHDFSGIAKVTAEDLAELHSVRGRLEEVFYAPDDTTATGRTRARPTAGSSASGTRSERPACAWPTRSISSCSVVPANGNSIHRPSA